MTGLTGNAVFSGGADAGGTSSDIVLSGNTIQNTQNSAGPPGDIEFNDTINSVIANNLILNTLTLTGSYAIQVFPNHAGGPGIPDTVSNVLVRGNVIRGISGSQTGIALQGSSCTSPGCGTYKNIRIEGNAIDGFVTAVSYDTRNSSSTINNAVGVGMVGNNISNSSGAAVWV